MGDFLPSNQVTAENAALCAQLALWAREGDGMMVLRYVEQLIRERSTRKLLDMPDSQFWPMYRDCVRQDCLPLIARPNLSKLE